MSETDHSVFLSSGRIARRAMAALILGFMALAAAAAAPPKPINLDSQTTACLGLRIAAQSPENVVVAWITADPARPLCYRQRLNYMWEPIKQVAGQVGERPRDLAIAFDGLGRLNLVWTGLEAGSRRVFFARLDGRGGPTPAGPLSIPQAGDADFPALRPDTAGGAVIVWQESRDVRFGIRAVRVEANGALRDLGNVSGASPSGLSPQVIATHPVVQVAWYEINETGSQLRVDDWRPAEARWRPSALERDTGQFPPDVQVLLQRVELGLMACWQDVLANGRGGIKVGLKLTSEDGSGPLLTQELTDPPGRHTRPTFSGMLTGHLTLAWQVAAQGAQSVRLALIPRGGYQPMVMTVSPAEQRFAARPDHATCANWSGVVWTDDVQEGGGGGVYFTQVNWPNLP